MSALASRALRSGPVLAVVSLLLALLCLELGLRVSRRRPESRNVDLSSYVEHDPQLGWRKRPGARVRLGTAEAEVEIAINSRGLRDPERDPAARGAARVLLLGDSFVEAFSVPEEQGVARVLEALLARSGTAVEVVNGGSGGYSTDQEYLFYRGQGAQYAPRVVLLFFYYNDVLFNARDRYWRGRKPYFVVEDGVLALRGVPVPVEPPSPPAPPAAAAQGAQRHSALLGWIGGRLRRGAPGAYSALAGLGLWPPLQPVPPPGELRVFERRPPPVLERGWDLTGRLLRALDAEARGHGARFAVVRVPDRIEVNDGAWELTLRRHGWSASTAARDQVLVRLRSLTEAAGIPLLDPAPALRAADHGPLGGPYYREDLHWNAAGHEVVAREIAAFLEQRGWLLPGERTP